MDQRVRAVLELDADISKAKGSISQLSSVFQNMGNSKGNNLVNLLDQIGQELDKLQSKSGTSIDKIGDFSKAEKSTERISLLTKKLYNELGNLSKLSGKDLEKLFPSEVTANIKKASDAIKVYNSLTDSKKNVAIQEASKAYSDQAKEVQRLTQQLKDYQNIQNGTSTKKQVTSDEKSAALGQYETAKTELKSYKDALSEAEAKMAEFKARKAEMFAKGTQNHSSEFRTLNAELSQAQANFGAAKQRADDLKNSLGNMVVVGDLEAQIRDTEASLSKATIEAERLKANLNNVNMEQTKNAIEEAKKKLEGLTGVDLSKINDIEQLNELFKRLTNEGIEGFKAGVKQAQAGAEELGNSNERMSRAIVKAKEETLKQNQAMENINGLKSRIQYFFSLTNTVQLARRAIQQAFETVKELDKAMTETAVVTDFSVGDMWEQLPRYTKAANDLGTTTKGAYETMTLFYQQGLDTNEVFEIGTETMKMARIAGLEYADATNLMTAALRGFNMELNETSAQRINDVYSELAAITAADTNEIATAMTKTASIAANANMEFETTAALLSQIIETTREPAETAGTAMKTIIARFTEMKKAASEVINVDGEEVNVNKVEAALKSAGVALRDVNGEFRDLDDVFLELSSKWNSLDMMTQRYVATMAAGSRQQSRFIAMMSDYDRTLELVDAAYNSSGASQRQFEKTQESLESKLNKLTNAWNEFLMGISNSTVIKGAVDLLTGVLNVVNKITGAFGSGIGGILKFGAALGALKVGEVAFRKVGARAIAFTERVKKDPKDKKATSFWANGNPKEQATKGLNNFTEKLNNFKEGKGFVLTADLDTKNAEKGLNVLEGKATETGAVVSASMEVAEEQVDDVGEEAVESGTELGTMGAGATTSMGTAKTALDLTEKEIEDIQREAAEARLALANLNPNINPDTFIDDFAGKNPNKTGLPSNNKIKSVYGYKNQDQATELLEKVKLDKNITAQLDDVADIADNATDAVSNVGKAATKTGTEVATTGTKGVGTFKAALGGAVKAMGSFIMAHPAVAAAAVAVGVAIAGVYATWYNSATQTTKRIAEADQATLENTQKELEATKTKIEELDNAWTELTNADENLSNMVQGTIEWKEQLLAVNEQIREILNKYPDLYKYLNIDSKTGQWSLDTEGYKTYQEKTTKEQEDLQNKVYFQSTVSNYSNKKWEATTKAAEDDYFANWMWAEEPLQGEYLDTLRRAYGLARGEEWIDQGVENTELRKLSLDDILNDQKTLDYIANLTNDEMVSNYWGMGDAAANPKVALKYYQDLEAAKAQAEVESSTYAKTYIASQGKYDEIVQSAAASVYADKNNFVEELEKNRQDRDGTKYTGGTTGTGTKMQGADDPNSVEAIMASQGYELKNKTQNIYYNPITGEYVNVDKVGGSDASNAETQKRKVDGKSVEVKRWSDEYVRDLGEQEKIRTQTEKDLDLLTEKFSENAELAKLAAGDLSADLDILDKGKDKKGTGKVDSSYTIKNDKGTELFNYKEKREAFEKTRSDEMDRLNVKYAGVFSSNGTKTVGNNTIKTYKQDIYEAAQEVVNFEKAVADAGTYTSQALTGTFLALKDLENEELGLNTIIDEKTTEQTNKLKKDFEELGLSADGFQTFVSKIDFSSSINGARQLKRALDEGGESAAYAKAVIADDQIGNNFFSVSNQFKEMISNEGWTDTQKALTEIYNLTGDISADNIRELAEENSDLAAILDTNSLKASGFAEMMKAVENGTISLADVTSDLIEIYDGLYYSADLAGEAIARLEKAEIGDSDTKIGNIYSESWGAVEDLIKRGAYGDSQIDDYMNQMVGETTWTEALAAAGGDKTKALETVDQTYGLSANKGNLYGSWTTQLNNLNGSVAGGAITLGADGKLNYDLSKVGSTQELVDKMVSEMGITEDYANTMLADMKTYSKTFGSDLDDLDKRGTLDSFLDSRTTKDGTLNISDSEKAAFAKARGQTVKEFEKDMKDTGKIKKFEDRKYSDSGYYYTTKDEENGKEEAKFTDDTAKENIKTKINEAKAALKNEKVDLMVDVKGDGGTELNQEYLNKLLQIEEVREIVLDPSLSDDQKKSLLSDLTGDLTEGVSGATANGIAEGLLGDESIANAEGYAEYLGTQLYNSLGGYLVEAMNLLATNQITIPVSFGGIPITIPDNKLTQWLGVAGKQMVLGGAKGELRIGGSTTFGTASFGSTGGGGFTPKTSSYSPQTVDVDAGEGDKDGEEGESYDKGDDEENDDDDDGGSKDKDEEEYEPINPTEYNAQQGLTGLEYDRYVNSREEELIGKLPSEIQGPLQLANLGEKMYYEAQEIGYNQQLADVYRKDMTQFEKQADYKDYYAFDEDSMTYQYNDKFMQEYETMDPKKRQAIDEEIAAANEVATKFREVSQELEGGKIQKAFRALEKSSKGVSKILNKEGKTADKVNKAFDVLEDKLGLNDQAFDKFGDALGEAIDSSELLNAEFDGLGDVVDKIEDGPLGKMLGESAKPVFETLKNGGTNRDMLSGLTGMGGDILGKFGDFANFDMIGMAMDGANMMKGMMDQGKQMMEQAAQYICQAIQVVVDAITNREDILFNYLNLIEKELQNYEKLQRYSTQLEKGRLASSEDIALNWDAQWESLQKQLEMQEFRVEQRQQQLEMSRWIPFQLISGWDPTSDTLYENREVKFAWDLMIGFGQMLPMFGQVFGSLNQLYEDYDKRVTEAYEDRLEAEQAILDIQDERLELVKVGSEEATEFEEKILEALVQKEQEAIDELTSINESITDANSKLLSTLQDKLDKLREQRENEKMEEELGEKERRLAYFRQNTGQGKLMDIKKLEEELEEGHESYTDQLIDQRIADLEKQNEEAAEQREKQIELLQAQLDWSEKYGLYWDQIYGMLYVVNDDGTVSMNLENFDLEGNLRTNGELSTLLNTFSDNIGRSIWSQLLENEELMRLGRYYQAFISRNGVTGEWGKYWALLDPGQDDPANAYVNPWDSRDVGFLLKGILAIESAINKYFILSDYGLANMAGRIEAAFKNTIGKLFGIEEWANYKFEGYRADHVNAPISEGLYDIGTAIGIYEKEPDNSTYKSYGVETGNRISKTENVKDTMYDIDLYIGEIFDSTGDAIDALTGFFADLFSTVHNVL